MHLAAAEHHVELCAGVIVGHGIGLPLREQRFYLAPVHELSRYAGRAGKLLADGDGGCDIHALCTLLKQKRAGLFADRSVRNDGETGSVRLVLLKLFCGFHGHALEVACGFEVKIPELAQAELDAHHHFPR